jgi:hypothetical protein
MRASKERPGSERESRASLCYRLTEQVGAEVPHRSHGEICAVSCGEEPDELDEVIHSGLPPLSFRRPGWQLPLLPGLGVYLPRPSIACQDPDFWVLAGDTAFQFRVISIAMEWASGPGTISDMIGDADAAGFQATERLVRDWTRHGLLDYPQRRPAGKGHGSAAALYPAAQRNLFVTLLGKRPGNNVASLARIPVCIWMHWGEDWVPLRQARRALLRWLGDPDAGGSFEKDVLRTSKRRALSAAKAITAQIESAGATAAARSELIQVLADANYYGDPDFDRIEEAVRAVFEPGYTVLRRAGGHPAAPVMTDALIGIFKARLTAVTALTAGTVTDEDLVSARDSYLFSYAEYVALQPVLATSSPAGRPSLYAPATPEDTVANCCGNLLSALGMELMEPARAAELRSARAGLRRPGPAHFGLVAPG